VDFDEVRRRFEVITGTAMVEREIVVSDVVQVFESPGSEEAAVLSVGRMLVENDS
jgi:hypothetical protein